MGISVDDSSSTLTVSERLAYPVLGLHSLAVGTAILNNFEVVVWGRPVIPPEILANLDQEIFYPLGNHPPSAIEGIIECRSGLIKQVLLKKPCKLCYR
jgi:hypothetical protein